MIVLRRAAVIESRHRMHVAVTDADGRLLWRAGDPDLVTFLRSAAKPFQALPLVADGAVEGMGIPQEELALACASHGGEPGHVEGVRHLLERSGIPEAALACGPHAPLSEWAASALAHSGELPQPIHNNCSGKHAGMLALARHHQWPLDGYLSPRHPVQRRMLTEVARWSGLAKGEIGTGVDGCGVVCFAMPLRFMARAYAALARASAQGVLGARGIVEAMVEHPWMMGGTDRLVSSVMLACGGSVILKDGAEGIFCGAERGGTMGFALKAEDGSRRAAAAAARRVLEALELLGGSARKELGGEWRVSVPNTRGEPAAFLEAELELEPAE